MSRLEVRYAGVDCPGHGGYHPAIIVITHGKELAFVCENMTYQEKDKKELGEFLLALAELLGSQKNARMQFNPDGDLELDEVQPDNVTPIKDRGLH